MAVTLEQTLQELNDLAEIAKGDPEAVHDLAINALLQYLDENGLGNLADAYRAANRGYWAADRG